MRTIANLGTVLVCVLCSCGTEVLVVPAPDAGIADAGVAPDSGLAVAEADAGLADAGSTSDAGLADAGVADAGSPPDAGVSRCGDGELDPGEECDPLHFQPIACTELGLGYDTGSLACDASCRVLLDGCARTTVCAPGAREAFYGGTGGTEGVGTCRAGERICASDGSGWEVTRADVRPANEPCGTASDTNCDGAPAPACVRRTGHPRLLFTEDDLPDLRARATAANPYWRDGLLAALPWAERILFVDNPRTQPPGGPFFLADGSDNPAWPDDGGSGVGEPYAEAYSQYFAFLALVDEPHRETYARRARNLLMHAIEVAAACPPPPTPYGPFGPYCHAIFPYFNRANYAGEAWGLTVDWLQGADPTGAIFTARDRALVRTVFLDWANTIIHSSWAPDLARPVLDALTPAGHRQLRSSANNYYSGMVRHLTLMALSLDPQDDPPIDGDPAHADVLGNTIRSYLTSWVIPVGLYQQYAMYEDGERVAREYGVASMSPVRRASMDALGLAAGGVSVEGYLYGHALAYVLEMLLALRSAGEDGVVRNGVERPQLRLLDSTYWDLSLDAFLAHLSAGPIQPGAPFAYLPPVYQAATYGDLLYGYVTDFDWMALYAALALKYRRSGDTVRYDQTMWLLTHTLPGGPDQLASLVGGFWSTAYPTQSILAFAVLDPGVPNSLFVDPRPGTSTTFYSKPLGRVSARTDWTADARWFTHLCTWASINHANGNCGQFELSRKGEWLTRERSGYDNGRYPAPPYGYGPDGHNLLSIENDASKVDVTVVDSQTQAAFERGGQFINDGNAGDPTTSASFGDGYVFTQDDATNLYNYVRNKVYDSGIEARDVLHASRSTLWLQPDHVFVYDRARSKSPGKFKRFNLVLVQGTDAQGLPIVPTLDGALVTGTTPRGQHLFVQAVLPATATTTLRADLVEELYPVALLDPTEAGPVDPVTGLPTPSGYRLQIEDTARPLDTRFLTVLQGADAGATADPAHRFESTGVAFDGVSISRAASGARNVAVLFRRSLEVPLPAQWTTTFTAPDAAAPGSTFVTDLSPRTTYFVSRTSGAMTISTTASTGAAGVTSDEAGVARF